MKACRIGVLATLVGLSACSPSLNWRTVAVEQLVALLPCKPDHAQRQVELGGVPRTLSMWGCEAGGALFAVSHVRVDVPSSSVAVITAWQLAALRNVNSGGAAPPNELPFKVPTPADQTALAGILLGVSGKRPDGQAVQAQLAWFSRGADVYHLAVFGPKLTPTLVDTFFTELRWQ